MIYTVTFNPAIDYVIHLDEVQPGEVNRSLREEAFFGGKGVNVSTVLANMGQDNVALGFIAGFTGEAIESGLGSMGIKTDFIRLKEGLTRINVKLKSTEETDINCQGPEIDSASVEELFGKLERLAEGDYLILAGSIPPSMPDDIYERIMARLAGRGINIVVDATKDLLLNVLKYKPFLVKPNNHELSEMLGVTLEGRDEIVDGAREAESHGSAERPCLNGGRRSGSRVGKGRGYTHGSPQGQGFKLCGRRRLYGGGLRHRVLKERRLQRSPEAGNGMRRRNGVLAGACPKGND